MRKILLPLLILFVLASCTPMKISVSEDLKASHDEYPVKGRQGILINQKLSFGEFATGKVRRSWTKGNSARSGIGWGGTAQQEWVNLISTEYINKKQTVNFSLSDGTRQSDVFCGSRFHAEDLQIGKSENSFLNIALDIAGLGSHSTNLYYVQLFTEKDAAPWQLLLDNQGAQVKAEEYRGVLAKSKTEYYTLVPVTKLERNGKSGSILGGSVGFEVHNPQGRAVAALSIIDGGMVMLGKTTSEERFLLANLCAALLLQENIGD